jgi:hypothetical protein
MFETDAIFITLTAQRVSSGAITGQSAVRLVSHERLELSPRPTKHIEINRTVDSDKCAGVVKLPDHPLALRNEGGQNKLRNQNLSPVS